MEMKDMNLMGLIGIIGAVILVIGVFLDWGTYTLLGTDYHLTGWDFYNKVDGVYDETQYTFVPLVALICGIISLALMVLPTFMNMEKYQQINNFLGIIALIMALVVVICGILFYTQQLDFGILGKKNFTDVYSVGIGFWLVLIGGIITLIGGIMPILKNKGIIKF